VIMVGNVDPGSVALNPAMSVLKEIDVLGSSHATHDDLKKVIELVSRGAIEPSIARFVPIEEVASVHESMESRMSSGRFVLIHGDAQ
jgi:acryloyl-coenzyme A reductase